MTRLNDRIIVRSNTRTGLAPSAALAALACIAALFVGGCSSAPAMTESGFLSDYSKLTDVTATRMRFVTPALKDYKAFIVDPVQIRSQASELSAPDRAEIAVYFRDAFVKVLTDRGYAITSTPGVGTARVRIALTNMQQSTWWMKVHPASSLSGAGRGGASMEGEVIDSVTGKQVAAVVQAGVGSQFTAFNYSTVSDIKSTIDEWAKNAGNRLDDLRSGK